MNIIISSTVSARRSNNSVINYKELLDDKWNSVGNIFTMNIQDFEKDITDSHRVLYEAVDQRLSTLFSNIEPIDKWAFERTKVFNFHGVE